MNLYRLETEIEGKIKEFRKEIYEEIDRLKNKRNKLTELINLEGSKGPLGSIREISCYIGELSAVKENIKFLTKLLDGDEK